MTGFGGIRHRNSGLGAKVLDDYFLDVAVAIVQIANGQQRFDTVFQSFAYADQQSGGEGDALLSRLFEGTQAFGRNLVGSVIMGSARGEKSGVDGFEHQAHAGRDCG